MEGHDWHNLDNDTVKFLVEILYFSITSFDVGRSHRVGEAQAVLGVPMLCRHYTARSCAERRIIAVHLEPILSYLTTLNSSNIFDVSPQLQNKFVGLVSVQYMNRFVIGFGLCLALVGLVVGFGVEFNGTPAYPDAEGINENYNSYVGDRAHLWGGVVDQQDGSVVIQIQSLKLELSSPPPSSVGTGDLIQVYGEFRPNHRMEVHEYHVQSPSDRRYMYGISIVGGLLAAGAFLRRWRVDFDRVWFVPREDS